MGCAAVGRQAKSQSRRPSRLARRRFLRLSPQAGRMVVTESPAPRRSARRASAGAPATANTPQREPVASPPRGRGSARGAARPPHPVSLAWWANFGRHTAYGNGLPRPLLRGWLHFAVLLLGAAALAARHDHAATALPAALRDIAAALNPTAHSFLAATLISYVGSVAFHLLPFQQLRAYQRVLCFDFCTIMCASHPSRSPGSAARRVSMLRPRAAPGSAAHSAHPAHAPPL